MSDIDRGMYGTIAVLVLGVALLVWVLFACSPGWEQGQRNDCERQGGQYINWQGDSHCYPKYTIPGTAPAYGR